MPADTPKAPAVGEPPPSTPGDAAETDRSAQLRLDLLKRITSHIPATLSLVGALLVVGVAGQGLWRSTSAQPWFETIAYGLPAFEAGKWWTPITGTFFVLHPWAYPLTLIAFVGMGYLEVVRGWRAALAYFWGGQLFAVLASAGFLALARLTPWQWARELALVIDAGPSGGAVACIAAAVGVLVAPWRQRAWIVVFFYAAVSVLFLGGLADLEHALAVLLVVAVDRSFRIGRTSVREQRMLAVASMLTLGIIQIVVLPLQTSGPFGHTSPQPLSFADVAIDTVIIVIAVIGLRRGRRWGWLLALALAALNTLIALLAFTVLIVLPADVADSIGDFDVTIASGILWFAYGIALIVTRRAFAIWRRRPLTHHTRPVTTDAVKALIRAEGGGTLSWMATWERMEYLPTTGGIVPFQTHARVAIVLADPLGPRDSFESSAGEFIAAAERNALTPCFFSASGATRDALPSDWRSLVVADDTIVDLEGLEFTGKAWSKVRQSFSRAERDGVSFRLTKLVDEPFAVRAQLQVISEQWVGDKGLPEMRFTLGTLEEAADPEVRLALAIAPDGSVDGLLSWLPVYQGGGEVGGWTLDLMRRREGGFPAVMEFLIGSSAKAFSAEGAKTLSLSGAPLAHDGAEDDGAIGKLLASLGAMLEPVYGFRSLHRFKKKFNPRYEPIYLLYRDEGDLTAIGAGLTRAFLPDATLPQLAAVGVDLVRGSDDG